MFRYNQLIDALAAASDITPIIQLKDGLSKTGLIVRHDIDLDVTPAFELAETLEAAGILTTFLFMTTSDTYNIASLRNRQMIRRMNDAGFEIGLHFDPLAYEDNSTSHLEIMAVREREKIEEIIGSQVHSVSLHNPSISGSELHIDGMINAYDRRIFAEDIYTSDSRMKEVDIVSFAARVTGRTAQLLLHPMHFSEDGRVYPWPMIRYIARTADTLDRIFRKNSEYDKSVGDKHLLDFLNTDK